VCLSQFFGHMSPFDLIVAIVAVVTAVYTFYKSFIEKARLALYPADRLNLVIGSGGGSRWINLHANLVNHAVKTGVLHRLEATMIDPSGATFLYHWRLFFEYLPGAQAVQPQSAPHPISVPGRSSYLLSVQLELGAQGSTPPWMSGRYQLRLLGWVNRPNRSRSPNLSSVFHFQIDTSQSQELSTATPVAPVMLEVPVAEWAT